MLNYDIRINNVAIGGTTENIYLVKSRDRELDFGRVDISKSTREEPYVMLDDFVILVDDGTNLFEDDSFIIESDNVTPLNQSQTLFKHEITLIERTKKLELDVVGTRAFAQPQTGIKKTTFDRIDELRQTSPLETTDRLNTTRLYEIGTSVQNLTLEAVEEFYNNVTHREAIDRFMDLESGVARLKRKAVSAISPSTYPFNVLEIDLFNKTRNLVDKDLETEHFQNLQNINQYGTKLDVVANNQVFDFTLAGGAIFEPNQTEFMGVRSDEGSFPGDSSFVELNFPKFRQIRIQMRVPTKTQGIQIIDITENVTEQEVYDTLLENDLSPANITGLFKANTLIWNFRSNRITNLFTLFNSPSLGGDQPVIELVIKSGLARLFGDSAQAISEFQEQDFEDLEFNVAYNPVFDSRSQVERIDGDNSNINKKSATIINQSDNILSVGKSLDANWVEAQQRGTPQFNTTKISKDISKIFDIGDFTSDGFVLTKRELVFKNTSYVAKYQFDKNYQKVSENLRTKSLPQLFEIPASDRTLKRNDYYNEYLIASFNDLTPDTTLLTDRAVDVFMNTLNPVQNANFNTPILHAAFDSDEIVIFKTPEGTNVPLNFADRIMLPVVSYGGGNSLNFYIQFNSPNIAGNQVYLQDTNLIGGTKPALQAIQYTDENGRLEEFSIQFLDNFNLTDKDDLPIQPTTSFDNTLISPSSFKAFKNSGDIETFTFGIQINPENEDDIIIGDRLIKRNNLIEVNASVFANARLISGDGRYDRFENKVGKAGHLPGAIPGYSIFGNRVIPGIIFNDSWAIVDDQNNLLLAVNQRQKDGTFIQRDSVFFVKKKERGDIINVY